jgi:predicted transcriptional regulator
MMKKVQSNFAKQGICLQYVLDNCDLDGSDLKAFVTILRHSHGFGKQYCFLGYDDFKMSKSTVRRSIQNLVELGLIEYSNTYKDINGIRGRSKNKYRILKPDNAIGNFVASNKKQDEIIPEW